MPAIALAADEAFFRIYFYDMRYFRTSWMLQGDVF